MAPADVPMAKEVMVAEAVTTFSDGRSTDFFVVNVDPESRELITLEFYEKRRDLGEIRLLKQVQWDVMVPRNARVFMPAGGLLHDHLNAVWVGWRSPDTLSALSMYQEFPIDVPLDAGMRLINPPVVMPNRNMVQYFWLAKDEAWSLCSFEFRGNDGEKGSVTRRRVRQTSHEPVISAASPAFGAEDDRAAVAWIERGDSGIKVCANLFANDSSNILETPVIPDIIPVQRQRLAVHADKAGAVTVGFVVESRIGGYAVMEVQFDFERHLYSFHPRSVRLPHGDLRGVCMFYYKSAQNPSSFVCAVSKEGTLRIVNPGSDSVQVAREQVDPDYDFPIVTSATGRYEAAHSGGKIELSMFP